MAAMLSLNLSAQCPIEGSAKNKKDAIANKLKNREIIKKNLTDSISLTMILIGNGDDSQKFSDTSFIKITGYLVEVKPGGKESCNCEASDDASTDTHIYIGLSPNAEKSECMIVEVTPRFKALHKGLNLHLMKGKEVYVSGYLFYDAEHKGNAVNTCKTCTNTWRKTCWEIHPVVDIELTGN